MGKKEDKNYNMQDFLAAVIEFEKNVLKSSFIGEMKTPLYLFSGVRKQKLVIITIHQMPWVMIDGWLNEAAELLVNHPEYSETIEFFCVGFISLIKKEEMQAVAQKKYQLNLSINDRSAIEVQEPFMQFFNKDDDHQFSDADKDMSRILFDYLAASQQSQDIKIGILHTLILFEIFKSKEIFIQELKMRLEKKLGRRFEGVEECVADLKKQKKIISLPTNKKCLKLSSEEIRSIEEVQRVAEERQKDFLKEFNEVTGKYGIEENTKLLEMLIEAVGSSYDYKIDNPSNISQLNVNEKHTENVVIEFGEEIARLLNGDERMCNELKKELFSLCQKNHYIDEMCAGTSFLGMLRSDNYEDYVNKKTNAIYLDTPAFVNYVCLKAEYTEKYPMWNDQDFISVMRMTEMVEDSKGKSLFYVPYDYVNEAVGELMKALRLSWFEQFQNVPIPIQTGNTFFNYYQYIRSEMEIAGDDAKGLDFATFIKKIGFSVTNPEDVRFWTDTTNYLSAYAKTLGCVVVPKVQTKNQYFDKVRTEYFWQLHDLNKNKKSEKAIDSDVRQALYLTEKTIEDNNLDTDFYFCTWDGSIRGLRDSVKGLYGLTRSYAVQKPSILINRISLKSFKISNECITNELFAYADKNYGMTDKVKSLFDNVLLPFFSALGKRNSSLVQSVLSMSKADVDAVNDGSDSSRDSNLPLENIFIAITDTLPSYQCTNQNLREFIENEGNEIFILDSLQKAYEKIKSEGIVPDDIVKEFCKKVQMFVDATDEEVRL